jgi:hypothetical protein
VCVFFEAAYCQTIFLVWPYLQGHTAGGGEVRGEGGGRGEEGGRGGSWERCPLVTAAPALLLIIETGS